MERVIKIFKSLLWCLGFAVILWGIAIPTNAHAQWAATGANISNTNSGNVGVGVTSLADAKFQVNGTGAPDYALFSDYTTATLRIGTDGGGNVRLRTDGTQNLIFGPGGTEKMRITSTGNVGIGMPAPNEKLEVNGTGKFTRLGLGEASTGTSALLAKPTGSQTQGNGTITLSDSGTAINNITIRNNSNNSVVVLGTDRSTGGGLAVGSSAFAGVVGTVGNAPFQLISNNNVRATIDTSGRVGIGIATPTEKLHVAGNMFATGNITANGNIAAKYQDVAEWVPSKKSLSPGTVVVLDEMNDDHVKPSMKAYDTRVAGVVSTHPGLILGEAADNKSAVATTGRVKARVTSKNGAIHRGDILVTSDVPGSAMRSTPVDVGGVQIHRPGTVVGKALEPLEKGDGEIMVLLTLQ